MFSMSDDGSDKDCKPSKTQAPPKKKVKRLCHFNNDWKTTYNWIREANQKDRAYCTVCSREFGIGHGGENDVKVHMKAERHKAAMGQAATSKAITSIFVPPKNADSQSKIAAAELAWAYHTNRHALSYRSLDCSIKLSRVTFGDSEVVTKMSCGRTKGKTLITNVLAPFSVELILSDLATEYGFYAISSDASNHGNRKMFPLCLRYFDVKNGISNRLLDFYEDYNETAENVKQKIVGILSSCKLDLAYLSAYSVDSANVNFGKFHSVYKLLSTDYESIMAAKCPANLVHNCAKKGCDLLSCDIEAFIMKVFGHFSVSSKSTEALNEIFDFWEMEGNTLLRRVPTRWLSLLPAIEKMLKCWPAIKWYFQSLGQEECPSLIWRYIEDETGEQHYSRTEIYMLFLQNVLRVFEETVRVLEKDELTAPELFDVMSRLRQMLQQRQTDSFFGHVTSLELRKMPPTRAWQIRQDFLNFFARTIAYLESHFDFSDSNYLCTLTPFSLKTRSMTYPEILCASEHLKMLGILDIDSLYDEYNDAKRLMEKQVACESKPVDKKWVDIFAEMRANSYKCKNLLLLVSKILSIPCSNAFVEKIFSFMSSHWTDTRNRCHVGLMRAELQVKVNFTLDCVQFYQYVKEKKDVLKAERRSEKYYWRSKQKV